MRYACVCLCLVCMHVCVFICFSCTRICVHVSALARVRERVPTFVCVRARARACMYFMCLLARLDMHA